MPRRFLSQAERTRLSQFPGDISANDCVVYFTLPPEDITIIKQQREAHNRLGFAMLLCSLRYLGYFPADIRNPPANVINYIAQQLELPAKPIAEYADRDETRRTHLSSVMDYLGFQRISHERRQELITWLGARALEHDQPSSLLQMACERLYQLRIVRPAITTMEEVIADARQWAEEKTVQVLVEPLPAEQRQALETLLVTMTDKGVTPLIWLRKSTEGSSDKHILDTLAKLAFVRNWPVETWAFPELPPSRLKYLVQLGRYTSNQGIRRKKPAARGEAILVAFLLWAYEKLIDELVDLFDTCLAEAYRKSRRELKDFQLANVERMQKVIGYFQEMTGVLLDKDVTDVHVRSAVYEQISPEVLRVALAEAEQMLFAGRNASTIDFFDRRYSYFRRFTPTFLEALTFYSHKDNSSLVQAIDVLRDLNQQEDKLPVLLEEAPTSFVPGRWKPRVLNRDDTVNRRAYELCVLSELRDSLRSGAIWVEGSRRYADLDSYLIPDDRWPELRPVFCDLVGIPEDGAVQIAAKQKALEEQLAHFDKQLPKYSHVRLEEGRLVLSPLKKKEDEIEDTQLTKLITELIPSVQSGELLAEVDSWTHFTKHLTHAGGSTSKIQDLPRHLYAVILAQACNIEFRRMAELADLSLDQLIWCANWYIREETLQEATNELVNYQYRQQLSHFWGDGTFSSSDGQRFTVANRTSKATPLPRYFGFGRGLTFLTWTSDQHSQYGTRVTPPTMRESTHVLDAILDNETELNIKEHTTDTAGYTNLVFALFDLLGLQFSPRLRDIGGHNLYCIDNSIRYKRIGPLISRPIDTDLILKHWDDLLRVAASLKMGWVTASTLISKLQAFPRQHKLTQVLQEYGRLVKTIFILNYLDDQVYRRRILVQLNKGENVHRLRRFLMFDNQGVLRKRQTDELVNQAGCLNLLSNAVIVWNTVYMQAAIDDLIAQGHAVNEEDFAHLSPVRYEHINPYGKFDFELSEELDPSGLRPLRFR